MKTVFALTSWGNSGVPWILRCLALNPKIKAWSCLTDASYSPLGRGLDAIDYLEGIGRFGWPEAPVCGDVHGVGLHEFPRLREAFGDIFRGAHLVAHPIQRIAGSFIFSHDVGRKWNHADFLRNWALDWNDPRAVAARQVLGEGGDHIPAHYMMNVNTIALMSDAKDVEEYPLITLEGLMAGDEEWDRLINHFSAGQIPDFQGLWRPLQGQYVGVAHQPFAVSPRAAWEALPDYAREMIAAAMTDESRQAFERLGYDLSFVV
jgi:hypothetical protein